MLATPVADAFRLVAMIVVPIIAVAWGAMWFMPKSGMPVAKAVYIPPSFTRVGAPETPPPAFDLVEWHVAPATQGRKSRVVGEVKNIGSIAMGARLHVVSRDGAGRIIESSDFWPAATANIAPGITHPFSYSIKHDPAGTVELVIVDGFPWPR